MPLIVSKTIVKRFHQNIILLRKNIFSSGAYLFSLSIDSDESLLLNYQQFILPLISVLGSFNDCMVSNSPVILSGTIHQQML